MRVAEAFPEINSVPKGTIVITESPETSLTMYIRSPTVFKVGSGRVKVVANVPVTATMSSVAVIVYDVSVVRSSCRTFAGSNVKPPAPFVLSTEPLDGRTVGHSKLPIVNVDVVEIEDVTKLPHEIKPDIVMYTHVI